MKKSFIIAALALASLTGCEKIKDKASKDIKANGVKFEFEAVTGDVASKSATIVKNAVTSSFSKTRTVDISELGKSELSDYANKVSKIVADNSLLKVTFTPAGNYTVTNLVFSAKGVTGSLSVPSYTVGSAFTPPANTNAYFESFVMKLIDEKSIEVTVTGDTDAPKGTNVKISYENDLVITVKLL